MMKNKLFVGVITFFVSLVLCIGLLNFTNSDSKKDYYFDRTFVRNNIFKLEKTVDKMIYESEYLMGVQSDGLIVEKEIVKNEIDKKEHKFYISDYDLKKISYKTICFPQVLDIRLFTKRDLFYVKNFELFDYHFDSKINRKIKLKDFKVVSLKTLKNSNSKMLCLGELFDGSLYKSGFFSIDIYSGEIILLKVLKESEKSNIISTSLQYSGSFTSNSDNDMITYCCNKYSRIYFFDSVGQKLVNEMITNEDVPLPKILSNKKGDSFYARGTTRNTNMGMFIKKNKIFVFSARSASETALIVDEYSLYSFKYEKSYRLNYANFGSKNIDVVFYNDNKVIIGFNTGYAFFSFAKSIDRV
ncbi:hypothetical protein SGQ83_11570 [Flavobacterium sp. Fl-318]|uniref:TolB-like 6-blade propeller-like n=1 Tax=Flavobacterium cupriresistens TaxID=2893885 RepID=A0ABU4RBN7_9FLAO|nr:MULTISPECIES: hypothetical protein [unclassified Flavobacterium]MDX6189989.1 hypothetical protein [Flavobacterium sp. Fl-318]UFH42814.1 hypothetical protein LNP23_01020 [Flavobacterium sp. F-323]